MWVMGKNPKPLDDGSGGGQRAAGPTIISHTMQHVEHNEFHRDHSFTSLTHSFN